MKTAGADGLKVKYPTGVTRRLDTAVRQNVLDGVRAINNDVLRQLGKKYGADGIEISAHALCAEDHLPYQGRQYSNKDFEALQNSLDRPFGQWNCKHTMYPIILGVSQPANDEATLQQYRDNSNALIDIDGKVKTRYQWSQEMRKVETAVRQQKDVANLAKASGDDVARREAQSKINRLREYYDKLTEKAGIQAEKERMTVSGFRAVKTVEQLKNPAKSDIIQVAGQTVNTKMREQKQQEHIFGTVAYNKRLERTKESNKPPQSAFYENVDVLTLVSAHMGKGIPKVSSDGAISEYFNAEEKIGMTYSVEIQDYEGTCRVCIRYSKSGWHAFPVKEIKKDD